MAVAETPYKNSWSVWVYPENVAINAGDVCVTDNLEKALSELSKGRKVLLSPPVGALKGIEGKFVPVFWSPIHFPKQAGSMGISDIRLCRIFQPKIIPTGNGGIC